MVDREAQQQTRWIREALWIRKTPTCMNRDAGSYQLSHTWDQVISRSCAPSGCKRSRCDRDVQRTLKRCHWVATLSCVELEVFTLHPHAVDVSICMSFILSSETFTGVPETVTSQTSTHKNASQIPSVKKHHVFPSRAVVEPQLPSILQHLKYKSVHKNLGLNITAYSSSEIQRTAFHRTLEAELSARGSCDSC